MLAVSSKCPGMLDDKRSSCSIDAGIKFFLLGPIAPVNIWTSTVDSAHDLLNLCAARPAILGSHQYNRRQSIHIGNIERSPGPMQQRHAKVNAGKDPLPDAGAGPAFPNPWPCGLRPLCWTQA